MNEMSRIGDCNAVTADRVPVEAYISADYVRLEKERLWPRVWQMACREEEIPAREAEGGERLESVLEANALLSHHSARPGNWSSVPRPGFHPVCRRSVLHSEVVDVERRRLMPP